MSPSQHRQMDGHQLEQHQTSEQRKTERAKESLPRFLGANVRNHEVTPDGAPGQIRAHVAEFCNRNQIEAVKLSGHQPSARSRSKIKNFRVEVEKPENVKQTEQR